MASDRTVAQVIATCLARHGVTILFSQSLPSAVLLAAEDIGLRQLTYRTENAGGAMADGFARISGKAAVVTAQNGPAATLLVPPLAEALKSSIPIVALVQEVDRPNADRNAFQELDHISLFQSCTKWVRRVTEASRIEDYVDMAFTIATSGRPGPTALLLPADLLKEPAGVFGRRQSCLGNYPLDRVIPDPAQIDAAADLIAAAQNPVVMAGGGVHLSGAATELAALQEEAHLPVMTTAMGKGAVSEEHPLSLGVGGNILGQLSPGRYLRPMIENADLVILVGTRTQQTSTDSWTLFSPGARYIHVDIDHAEIGRNYEGLRLVGDAKLTLAALTQRLRGRRKSSSDVVRQISAARARHEREIALLLRSDAIPIRPERLMADLQQVLTPDTIVVADASYSHVWVASYLRALKPGMRFLTPRGIGGLGWGLPMAIGARVARPTSPVLCVAGDGGFAHVWSELETARRTQTPVVVTVLNNGVLAYQKDAEDVKFGRHTSGCMFSQVDHAQIARACGCRGIRIERPADYLDAVQAALAVPETTVIDVITDPEAYPPITLFDNKLEAVRQSRSRV